MMRGSRQRVQRQRRASSEALARRACSPPWSDSRSGLPRERMGGRGMTARVFLGVVFRCLAAWGTCGIALQMRAPRVAWVQGAGSVVPGAAQLPQQMGCPRRSCVWFSLLDLASWFTPMHMDGSRRLGSGFRFQGHLVHGLLAALILRLLVVLKQLSLCLPQSELSRPEVHQ